MNIDNDMSFKFTFAEAHTWISGPVGDSDYIGPLRYIGNESIKVVSTGFANFELQTGAISTTVRFTLMIKGFDLQRPKWHVNGGVRKGHVPHGSMQDLCPPLVRYPRRKPLC